MPCYRCGARQTDPVRGASLWFCGVRRNEQVLVCPECQASSDWVNDLDCCPVCGSPALLRKLGRTVCRDCESTRAPLEQPAEVPARLSLGSRELSAEVADAIDRVLGRSRSVIGSRSEPGQDGPIMEASGRRRETRVSW